MAFFKIDNELIDRRGRFIGWKAILVYAALSRHANQERHCFPSIELMACELGISRKSVQRGIKDLAAWRMVVITKEKRKTGVWKNNLYRLTQKEEWNPTPDEKAGRVADRETVSPNPRDCESADQEAVGDAKKKHIEKEECKKKNSLNQIFDYFVEKIEKTKGFTPMFDSQKDAAIARRLLAGEGSTLTLGEAKEVIDFFVKHKKSDEHPTFSSAFSNHTINLWKLSKVKKTIW